MRLRNPAGASPDLFYSRKVRIHLKPLLFWWLLLFVTTNGASYFILSDGYGVVKWNDGLTKCGWPFLAFEEGGIDGRRRFCPGALVGNLLISLGITVVLIQSWRLAKNVDWRRLRIGRFVAGCVVENEQCPREQASEIDRNQP